jgi:hypothetical protein
MSDPNFSTTNSKLSSSNVPLQMNRTLHLNPLNVLIQRLKNGCISADIEIEKMNPKYQIRRKNKLGEMREKG